jgi:hypothetical protein
MNGLHVPKAVWREEKYGWMDYSALREITEETPGVSMI